MLGILYVRRGLRYYGAVRCRGATAVSGGRYPQEALHKHGATRIQRVEEGRTPMGSFPVTKRRSLCNGDKACWVPFDRSIRSVRTDRGGCVICF